MRNHFSEDQMSRFVTGDATAEERQHAAECGLCSAELGRLKETLSIFRESVNRWADENGGLAVSQRASVPEEVLRGRWSSFRWAFAGVILALLIAIPIYKTTNDRKREAQALEDTLLLERVNAQLSRTVPEPMEPLMKLIADPSADETGGRQ